MYCFFSCKFIYHLINIKKQAYQVILQRKKKSNLLQLSFQYQKTRQSVGLLIPLHKPFSKKKIINKETKKNCFNRCVFLCTFGLIFSKLL